jgi:hypothetical protein
MTTLKNFPDTIALFPLNVVLFPSGLLELRIFEIRYLDMIKDCLRNQEEFGIVLVKSSLENTSTLNVETIGTLAKIVSFDQGTDGLLHITVQGTKPFQINGCSIESNGLIVGKIQPHLTEHEKVLGSHTNLVDLLNKILTDNRGHETETQKPSLLSEASWVAYRLAEFLDLTNQEKLTVLSESNAQRKLDKIEQLIVHHSSEC